MRLADSKIFRGDDATLDPKKPVRKERKIFVYVPASYQDGTKAAVLVTLDGPSHLNLVRHALDNLTISKDPERKLPAFIAIAVENGGNDSRGANAGWNMTRCRTGSLGSSTTKCCRLCCTTRRSERLIRIWRSRMIPGAKR